MAGLKYAIEVGKTVDDPNPVYHCSICDDHFNSVIKIKHFTNPRHRKAVLVRMHTCILIALPKY